MRIILSYSPITPLTTSRASPRGVGFSVGVIASVVLFRRKHPRRSHLSDNVLTAAARQDEHGRSRSRRASVPARRMRTATAHSTPHGYRARASPARRNSPRSRRMLNNRSERGSVWFGDVRAGWEDLDFAVVREADAYGTWWDIEQVIFILYSPGLGCLRVQTR